MRPEDIDLNSDEPLYVFSEKESVERIDTLHDLILQHLGKNWKTIVVLLVIFTVLLLVLLTFGVTIDAEHKHHLQAFLVVFIISLSFWLFYILVMPSKDKTVMTGIVPYPKDSPYVPVDNTLCGTSVVNCTKEDVCDTKCTKNNESNYTCTEIEKDVIYLGSKLQKGQSYCLPKEGVQELHNCGTYTGKAVWSGNQRWECQCLYPDFFGGDYCLDQIGCQTNGQFSVLTSKDGKTWDPSNKDANNNVLAGHSPYEVGEDGKPVYSCGADKNCIIYPEDPFTCHSNLCDGGSVSLDPSIKFDTKTMSCECNENTIKSNISGYCYPYPNIALCKPHPKTKLCTFGLDLSGSNNSTAYLFTTKGNTYFTFTKTDDKGYAPYTILVDLKTVPSSVAIPAPFNIDSTIIKDAFYSYPIVSFTDLPTGDQATVTSVLLHPTTGLIKLKTDKASFDQLFEDASKFNGEGGGRGYVGYPTLCSSFYQKRDDSYPQCKDVLSTIGVDYNTVCDKTGKSNPADYECGVDENGKSVGNCFIDITQMDGIKGMLCNNCMSINKSYRDPYIWNFNDHTLKRRVGHPCVKCENNSSSSPWVCCSTIDGNPYIGLDQVCRVCPEGCKTCDFSRGGFNMTCTDPTTCKIGLWGTNGGYKCCPSNNIDSYWTIDGTKNYCTQLPPGTGCKSDAMCASNNCSGRVWGIKDGTCT